MNGNKNMCPREKNLTDYVYSDFKPLTYKNFKPLPPSYVFRGDSRSLESIEYSNGFGSQVARGIDTYTPGIFKKYGLDIELIKQGRCDEEIKKIDELWMLYERMIDLWSDRAYVSASRNIVTSQDYGKNVYAVFTKKGIDLPILFEQEEDAYAYHHEVVIPLRVKFDDIIGTRVGSGSGMADFLFVGPVFLKENFESKDSNNFWQLIQLFGGKSQVREKDLERKLTHESKLAKICADASSGHYINNINNCREADELWRAGLSAFPEPDETSRNIVCFSSGFPSGDKNSVIRKVCADIQGQKIVSLNGIRR